MYSIDPNFGCNAFTHPLLLRDGSELRTLQEAALFLHDRFAGRRGVKYAGTMLTLDAASRTGKGADIFAARRTVEALFQDEKLL